MRSLVKELPQYRYVYLGDTARTPYGNRSQETIYQFTKEAITALFSEGCDFVIVACNTASSEALRRIQMEYLPEFYPEKKVLGVLIPAAEEAAEKTKNKRVGVLATVGTVASGAFVREIQKVNPGISVFQEPAPLLVPAIEAGEHALPSTELLMKRYLQPLMRENIDTLILGCTHYSIVESTIKKLVGEQVAIVTEGEVVAKKLRDYLERHPEVESLMVQDRSRRFLTTDLTDMFGTLGSEFFGTPIHPEKIMLS